MGVCAVFGLRASNGKASGDMRERMRLKQVAGALAVCGVSMLTGCAGFFLPNTTTTSTTTSTGDYLYAVNNSTNSLSEFVVGSGALTAVSGSPIALATGLAPVSVAVSRPNTFVFVGGSDAIEVYSIGTTGALTSVSGAGVVVQNTNFSSLETSPDGNWLLGLDSLSDTVRVYGINTTTGVLSVSSALTIGGITGAGTMTPKNIRISPNGSYVAVALGTGGVVLFTFNTSTGLLTEAGTGIYSSAYTDNAVAFDATSTYLWVARQGATTGTSGIATFSISTGAIPTGTGTLVASGDSPYALLVDSTGAYVYSANRASGNVSGYTNASGVLTQMASSPFLSGVTATTLAEDNAHKYVIAGAYGGSSDLTLYGLDAITGGKLDAIATSLSGSDPAGTIAIAATH